MNEKIELEKAACNHFLKSYNRINRTNLNIVNHRDRPDFVAKDFESGQVIGIEVTHLPYDDDEAKMLLGRSNKRIHGVMDFRCLIEGLNNLLEKKNNSAREYVFDNRMFLIIRVMSPIFDKSDFDDEEDIIHIPPTNVFNEIWLVLYNSSRQEWGDLKRLK